MGRRVLGVLVLALSVGVAAGAVAVSRGGDKPSSSNRLDPPAASQRAGDDADLMRRLERRRLVQGGSR